MKITVRRKLGSSRPGAATSRLPGAGSDPEELPEPERSSTTGSIVASDGPRSLRPCRHRDRRRPSPWGRPPRRRASGWVFVRLVRTRGLRRLLAVRFATQWADGVFQAALGGAVLFNPERQADPLAVAAGLAVLLLPYSLIGPFAGALLDRWDRKRVLMGANLVRAVLIMVVAAVVFAGVTGPALYLAALAVAGVSRFVNSGLSVSLPHVVERRHLVEANTFAVHRGRRHDRDRRGLRHRAPRDRRPRRHGLGHHHHGRRRWDRCSPPRWPPGSVAVLSAPTAPTRPAARPSPCCTGSPTEHAPPPPTPLGGRVLPGAGGPPVLGRHHDAAHAAAVPVLVHRQRTVPGRARRARGGRPARRGGPRRRGADRAVDGAALGSSPHDPRGAARRHGHAARTRRAAVHARRAGGGLRARRHRARSSSCAPTPPCRARAGDGVLGRVFALYDVVFNVGYVLAVAAAALLSPPNGLRPRVWPGPRSLRARPAGAASRCAAPAGY